jgi:protein required for attachment to host cells
MKKPDKLWVAVADGEHARIVVPHQGAARYHTLHDIDSFAAHRRAAEMGTDAPGRSFESASMARHAIEPRSDPHLQAKHDFVVWLAGWLGEQAIAGAFNRLILVAPAHALHDLRAALPEAARQCLCGVLPRDLVKTPDHDMAEHLSKDVVSV